MTGKIVYLGDLRCKAIHQRSGNEITSDAPVDNNGKGEAFSPTDLVGAALATCMITVMGISARKNGWTDFNANADYKKTMLSDPRRIGKLEVFIEISGIRDEEIKAHLEERALNCPVALSLAEELEQVVEFNYV